MNQSDSIAVRDGADKNYIGKKEKWTYGITAMAQGAMYGLVSACQMTFYTDVVGAAGEDFNLFSIGSVVVPFLTLILIIAKVWDAVNDPIMGYIMDLKPIKKTKDKMKPWLIVAAIPTSIFTILIFINPNLGADAPRKWLTIFYILITYMLWDMTYTLSDVPFWSLPSVMSPNEKERDRTLSFGRTVNAVGGAIPYVLPVVALVLFPQNWAYFFCAIILAGWCSIMFFVCNKHTKERIVVDTPKEEQRSIKENLKLFKNTKPLVLVFTMGILCFGRYMVQIAVPYVTKYVFAYDYDSSIVGLIWILTTALIAVGMFPAMLMMPKLYKKFSFKQISIGAGALALAIGTVFFIVGVATNYNLWVALPFLLLSGLPLGVFNIVSFNLIADCVDYMEWKSGIRAEGLCFSAQTFMSKFGSAIAAAVMPIVISTFRYIKPIEKAEAESLGYITSGANIVEQIGYYNGANFYFFQGADMRMALFLCLTLVPGISMFVSIIPMFFYKYVGEEKEKILTELNSRRTAVGEIISEKAE